MPRSPRRSPAPPLVLAALLALGAVVPAVARTAPPIDAPASAAALPVATRTAGRPDPAIGSLGSIDLADLDPAAAAIDGADVPAADLDGRPVLDAGSADGLSAQAVPPAPALATSSGVAAPGAVGWEGLTDDDNGVTFIEPPSSSVAAGPDHVLAVVNRNLRITNRGGGDAETVSLSEFFHFTQADFPLPHIAGWGDPRVAWDDYHGRWIVTMVAWECANLVTAPKWSSRGIVLAAVSESSTPDFWNGFYLDYTWDNDTPIPDDDTAYLPVTPTFGTSTDKLGIGVNEYVLPNVSSNCESGISFDGSSITVFDWADLLPLTLPVEIPVAYLFDGDIFNWRPVLQTPASSANLYAIGESNAGASSSDLTYIRVTGSARLGNVTVATEVNLTTSSITAQLTDPPQPADPGGAIGPAVVDRRITDAVYQGGRISMVANYPCTPTGDTISRTCVRVMGINVAAGVPTPVQDVLFGGNGESTFFGGIARSVDGALHVAYSVSSAGLGISARSRYQRPTDAAGAFSATVGIKTGTTVAYAGDRWGRHLQIAQDPIEASAAWVAMPYTMAGGGWATRVAQIQLPGADYVPVTPVRVLDTRVNNGLSGAFQANIVRTFGVAGRLGIPSSAVAITGNLTVTGQTASGYVSLGPIMTTTPSTSSLNFPLGDSRANNVTLPLSTTGNLSAVYKAGGGRTAHVILDITGYFTRTASGATYVDLTPVRLLDTRAGNGLSGTFETGVPRHWQVTGRGGVPMGATAVTANVTVVGQTSAGYVSVTPTDEPNPTTSTLNFPVGDNRANGLAVQLGPGGMVSATYKAAAGARADLLFDVTGYFVDGAGGTRFVPLRPGRRLDSRIGQGLSGAFTANVARTLQVRPYVGVAPNGVAITGNLTITGQSTAGYVSMTETATSTPTTSTINFPNGDVRANGVFAPLAAGGSVGLVYKWTTGTKAHLVLDITGYFR